MKARITDQVILGRITNYGESSLVLQAYSRTHGHIGILAKGIRKKQPNPPLQAFCAYQMTLYEPAETGMYLFAEASLSREAGYLSKAEICAAAGAAMEVISQLVIAPEESAVYYDLLEIYLVYLEKVEENAVLIFWRWLLRVFKVLGVEMTLHVCGDCGGMMNEASASKLGSGMLLCHDCADQYVKSERAEYISATAAKTLALLPVIGEYIGQIRLRRQEVKEINQILMDYFREHYHKTLKLKSLSVLEQYYSI